MNNYIQVIKDLDLGAVKEMIARAPKWLEWAEPDGKNALHYLCGVPIEQHPGKEETSLQMLKLLLKSGMDIDSIHRIPERGGYFPGTPLWYAYTRGRNVKLYTYLLSKGANPQNCMYAITWYDDAKAATLFKKYGALIDGPPGMDSPLMAAFAWKKFKMAAWLLKNGAEVDAVDQKGATALFHSVRRKYDVAHIKLLVKFGADPDKQNHDGKSPRKLASSYRDKTIVNIFS